MNLLDFTYSSIKQPTPADTRLAPYLEAFEEALQTRAANYLYERPPVIGDFAVARIVPLNSDCSIHEKVTLTVYNVDDESKDLQFVVSIEQTLRGLQHVVWFDSVKVVELTEFSPFKHALDRANESIQTQIHKTSMAMRDFKSLSALGF
jgi:hypothetical protein